MMNISAVFFIRFFDNHGLLQIINRPNWWVIKGGSKRYVDKIIAKFKDKIRLSTPVKNVKRDKDLVTISSGIHGENEEDFDAVVFATHSDQSLALLEQPTKDEVEILGSIIYQNNDAVLHFDDTILPKRKTAWSSWNYIENQTNKLALALKVKGFMNVQFAIKKDKIYVIEVNPRASRTVPFVSKAKGLPLAKVASRVMAGEKLSKFNLKDRSKKMFAVKEAVFPFNKFPNSDLLLGPEMKSTGEVMGFDKNFGMAFAKSQIASANSLPKNGLAFISLKNSHKDEGIDLAKELIKLNFTLCATRGTAEYIRKHGMRCKIINKVSSGSPHIVDVLDSKKIALVINTGGGNSEHRLNDAIALRRGTLKNKVPYCTNMSTALACLQAIKSLKTRKLEVTSLQDI